MNNKTVKFSDIVEEQIISRNSSPEPNCDPEEFCDFDGFFGNDFHNENTYSFLPALSMIFIGALFIYSLKQC